MNNDPVNKSGEGNGDPLGFSKLGEMDEKKEYVITDETKIDEIEGNLEKYLENDLDLESNLLTYALKEKLEENPEELKKVFVSPNVKGKLKEKGAEYIAQMIERIRNLETFETEHYVWMVPKDQWEEGKIELPENEEGKYLAPSDLTAILKKSDGDEAYYDGDWKGKEVRHFVLNEELLEAENSLLKPLGYSIPEEWETIIDGIKRQLENDGKSIENDELFFKNVCGELSLDLPGLVNDGELMQVGRNAYFLQKQRGHTLALGGELQFSHTADKHELMYFVNPVGDPSMDNACSVRCVC